MKLYQVGKTVLDQEKKLNSMKITNYFPNHYIHGLIFWYTLSLHMQKVFHNTYYARRFLLSMFLKKADFIEISFHYLKK